MLSMNYRDSSPHLPSPPHSLTAPSLSKMYMYKAPLLFYSLWHLVKPFLEPAMKAKVHFLHAAEQFDKAFDPQVMPQF